MALASSGKAAKPQVTKPINAGNPGGGSIAPAGRGAGSTGIKPSGTNGKGKGPR